MKGLLNVYERIIIDTTMDRIKTGIAELDRTLGGFPAGKTILVTGDPGTGKTIFGLQFANECCLQGMKTVFISTEESAGDLRMQGNSFGWDIENFEKKGLLRFIELAGRRALETETAICISVDTMKGNFVELLDNLPEGTQTLVLDSLGSHAANLTPYEFRDRFDLFTYTLAGMGITALIILDTVTSKQFNDIALFSTYGAIQLMKKENPYTGKRERVMDIVKMRNTKTTVQLLSYKITTKGIDINTSIDI
jgi:KaiC/GvpD/RAD55 family RecA-like ATPase